MIIGHLAVAGIAKKTWFESESLLLMSLAALGPDLIDKPAHLIFGFPGRGVSHSLAFFLVLILLALLSRSLIGYSKKTMIAGLSMWGTHLVGDFLEFHILLWPFGGQAAPGSRFNLMEKFWQFYIERYYFAQFWLEVTSIVILAALLLSTALTYRARSREEPLVADVACLDRE